MNSSGMLQNKSKYLGSKILSVKLLQLLCLVICFASSLIVFVATSDLILVICLWLFYFLQFSSLYFLLYFCSAACDFSDGFLYYVFPPCPCWLLLFLRFMFSLEYLNLPGIYPFMVYCEDESA